MKHQRLHSILQSRLRLLAIFSLFMVIVLGCNLTAPTTTFEGTPTKNPLFELATPTPEESDSPQGKQINGTLVATEPPQPTRTLAPQTPTPTPPPPIIIFDEQLHPDWELTQSDVAYDPGYTRNAYSGVYSMQFKPDGTRQVLWFTLKKDAAQPILQKDVIGVTFRLYSGESFLRTSDLVSAVIGSNKYPYWVENDESVIGLDPDWQAGDTSITRFYDESFSPTRLYFLGINNDIPPRTWVWVTNWFDERTFDIDYTFITGMYIRNDDGFRGDVLIDDVRIVLAP